MGLFGTLWNWAVTPVSLQAMQSPSILNPALYSKSAAQAQNLVYTGLGQITGITPPAPENKDIGSIIVLGGLIFLAYKLFKR